MCKPENFRMTRGGYGSQTGVSLIIVMVMVVIIGLTSAAAIRGATSNERVTNNIRMQSLAQQYSEAALRYCEAEIIKPDADRVATLRNANIVQTNFVAGQTTFQTSPAPWELTATWVGTGGASASKTSLPQVQIKSSASSVSPTTLPQCVAERQVMADGTVATILTSRGFSPGYTANATSGATTGGSVVWLQSILLLE